ncbi:hypothetical protein [Dongia rigui]|uniref:Uncharacterized protein n=1 Tax=Dongia rigui TaxID=940149 RepID=A0ABU5DZT2_9PROT|nr:hypothetical protein [Dongia rigui]MDY0872435.1 hypothetical protein [Dongia rigui]
MTRISHLIAGAALMLAVGSSAALAETGAAGDAVAVVSANLPAGVTLDNASERQLGSAVRRAVRAHPELSGAIVEDVTKAVPSNRKATVKKAVSAAKAPYARTTGRGGHL